MKPSQMSDSCDVPTECDNRKQFDDSFFVQFIQQQTIHLFNRVFPD